MAGILNIKSNYDIDLQDPKKKTLSSHSVKSTRCKRDVRPLP